MPSARWRFSLAVLLGLSWLAATAWPGEETKPASGPFKHWVQKPSRILIVAPIKLEGGSGGPVRVFALLP